MMPAKNLLLTGKPGTGKTTALKKAIKLIEARAGGFYTEEIRKGGERVGFDIVTLSGDRQAMAKKGSESPHRVGSYGIDVDTIDTLATGSIADAIAYDDLIVIDEIGKMELFSRAFRSIVVNALDSRKPVLAVIMAQSNDFADQVKNRDDVEVIEVTKENRDEIPGIIKRKVEGLIRR